GRAEDGHVLLVILPDPASLEQVEHLVLPPPPADPHDPRSRRACGPTGRAAVRRARGRLRRRPEVLADWIVECAHAGAAVTGRRSPWLRLAAVLQAHRTAATRHGARRRPTRRAARQRWGRARSPGDGWLRTVSPRGGGRRGHARGPRRRSAGRRTESARSLGASRMRYAPRSRRSLPREPGERAERRFVPNTGCREPEAVRGSHALLGAGHPSGAQVPAACRRSSAGSRQLLDEGVDELDRKSVV